MKAIKYACLALLALPLLTACSDDDYKNITPTGNPVITVANPTQEALMGDDITFTVNCRDNGGIVLLPFRHCLC